jgi:hypothetical protein
VVAFRKDARTVAESNNKIKQLRQRLGGGGVTFDQNVVAPILVCEQAARRRGLDLEVAAADAKYWWKTGLVPLRPTPLAGTPKARRERERLQSEKPPSPKKRSERTIESEADSLEEARERLLSQVPEGFALRSERVISDGKPQALQAFGDTTKAALAKVQSRVPSNAEILEWRELTAPEWQVIMIQAPDEKTARKRAKVHQTGRSPVVKRVKLITPGSKGFLGIGRKLDEYEVKVLNRAIVEVTYKPMAKISARAVKTPGKPEKKPRKKRIEVSPRGSDYDSAPLLLEEAPDLEQLFADPPIIQKPTEENREFWASAEAGAQWRRMTLVAGYLQHPKPEVRLATLGLMEKHELSKAAALSQMIFDLLAADPDETVRQEVARITWLSERDVNCEYAVNKARDEIAYGSDNDPVGPTRARRALELLVQASPDEDAKRALEHLISLPWP